MDAAFLMEFRTYVIAIVLSFLMLWVFQWLTRKPKNLPPGPRGWPLVGHFPIFMRSNLQPLQLLESFVQKYGNVLTLDLFSTKVVIVNDFKLMKEAFQGNSIIDRPAALAQDHAAGVKNNGIVFANGNNWRDHRQLTHSVFRSFGVGTRNFEDTIMSELEQLGDAMEATKGAPFDPDHLFTNAISNIICSVVFGTQYKYSDPEFKKALSYINGILRQGSTGFIAFFFPYSWVFWLPFGLFDHVKNSWRKFYRYIDEHLTNHKDEFDDENVRDFIDVYLKKIAEKQEAKTFSNVNLLATIGDLFIGGTETTSTTLRWAVLYMMANPDVQARVQEELDRVVGSDRNPRLSDRLQLAYTEAVLHECQRISPIAPLAAPHVVSQDTRLDGYDLPKGTLVLPNLYHVMRDDQIWEDPTTFNPGRFLTKDGKFRKRDAFIPFGIGKRSCVGEQLAKQETFLGFARLLQRFTFKNPDDSKPLSFEGEFGATLTPPTYQTCAIKRQ